MKFKKYFTVILAALFIFGFSVWGIVAPDKQLSLSERRVLAQFPEFNSQTVFSGRFMSEFETYSLEQFPMRDSFRGFKAGIVYKAFGMKDNNGIFFYDDHIFKTEYPYNESSVKRAVDVFGKINNNLLTENNKVYFSVIPDKNYFLPKDCGQLVIDYEKLIDTAVEAVDFAEYINISDLLSLNDYYLTDSHWRQENISDVANRLLTSMGADLYERNYKKHTSNIPFKGVYYGQSSVKGNTDTLCYLTDTVIDNAVVFDWETGKNISVYDLEKLSDTDPYEMFLHGSRSLLTIENSGASTDKELIIFRDSFGSSIAPLMLSGYKKVTLVDIRYLPSAMVSKYIDFNDQDVLFLYSTSVLNNSITLK